MQLGTMPSLELQGRQMRRREFITFLGGSMVAWPCAIRAQQVERVRRIGVLSALAAEDPQGNAMIAAFKQGLQQLGWADGRNLQTEYRWGAGNADDIRKFATELVSHAPDVLVATGGSSVGPLLQATKIVPIVFANVPDPVGSRAAMRPVLRSSNTI
jgi:putative tryptophan/tyrosine transport system substrate-binding protein